jgi:hypothetical protein
MIFYRNLREITFRLTNVIPEQIIFVSRGITVLHWKCFQKLDCHPLFSDLCPAPCDTFVLAVHFVILCTLRFCNVPVWTGMTSYYLKGLHSWQHGNMHYLTFSLYYFLVASTVCPLSYNLVVIFRRDIPLWKYTEHSNTVPRWQLRLYVMLLYMFNATCFISSIKSHHQAKLEYQRKLFM